MQINCKQIDKAIFSLISDVYDGLNLQLVYLPDISRTKNFYEFVHFTKVNVANVEEINVLCWDL